MNSGSGRARFFVFSLAFLVLGFKTSASAEDPPQPTFKLMLADGTVTSGHLTRIDEDWSVRLAGDKEIRAAGLEIVSLRRDKSSLPNLPRTDYVILANGDELVGKVRELSSDRLHLAGDLGQDFAVPISAASIIWRVVPEGVENPYKWRRRLAAEKRSRDTIYLRNGDIVEGVVNSLKEQTLQIESAKKEVSIALEKVAVIAFNTDLVRLQRAKRIHGRLVLDNGSRLTLASIQADQHQITGKTLFGGDVTIPIGRLVALDWLGGCAVYLSDLKPRAYQFESFLGGTDWPYVTDASVMESPIQIGGQRFDKGLGMHTSSRLTYSLDANDRWFEAVVGVDDGLGKNGSARIRVLLDGKPQKLHWDGMLTGPSKPRQLRVSLAGAKELTLVADFGELGDVQGCVDWADARLLRKPK
jgi:hypothetical protein